MTSLLFLLIFKPFSFPHQSRPDNIIIEKFIKTLHFSTNKKRFTAQENDKKH